MQKNKTLLKSEWNKSYGNKNNFLFIQMMKLFVLCQSIFVKELD